jgi:formyltetrahydrofolate deformylase
VGWLPIHGHPPETPAGLRSSARPRPSRRHHQRLVREDPTCAPSCGCAAPTARASGPVTKENHCLYDLLGRCSGGELDVEIPLIVSNRDALRHDVEKFGIPFHHVPIEPETKAAQEQRELELLAEAGIDLVVLARYMQILSPAFLQSFAKPVINIHHSFLPAFVGADPYRQAYERGVKIIGATSHYVTEDLDQGPIIEQRVVPVTHRDSVRDLVRQGRDLEKVVLARAVWNHVHHRILVYGNKTVVF